MEVYVVIKVETGCEENVDCIFSSAQKAEEYIIKQKELFDDEYEYRIDVMGVK